MLNPLPVVSPIFSFFKNRKQRKALESYLKAEKEKGEDKGQRSIPHLQKALGLTEDEIRWAAKASKVIKQRTRQDESGMATTSLFEFDPN
jgi:hypothetical protein